MSDPAERLRAEITADGLAEQVKYQNGLLDAALAAERRATVERIRGAVNDLPRWDKRSAPGGFHVYLHAVHAILDNERDR